jgi:cadmium resistance protein CadD (predicted permease)
MNTPSPSFASQTLAKMMVTMMVLVLNIRNLRERNTLMAMVIVHHKELERQRTNMMAMAIINFKKHERTTIHTIYERE